MFPLDMTGITPETETAQNWLHQLTPEDPPARARDGLGNAWTKALGTDLWASL